MVLLVMITNFSNILYELYLFLKKKSKLNKHPPYSPFNKRVTTGKNSEINNVNNLFIPEFRVCPYFRLRNKHRGINVGPGNFVEKNKRVALNKYLHIHKKSMFTC